MGPWRIHARRAMNLHEFRLAFFKHSLQSGHRVQDLPGLKSPFSISAEASFWRRFALRTKMLGSYTCGIFTGVGGIFAAVVRLSDCESEELSSDLEGFAD